MILSQPSLVPQYRVRHGWSQAQLAERSGVSRTEISAIENGRVVPSVAVALRLAAALGESVEAVFGGSVATPAVPWAWPPPPGGDLRLWRATVNGRLLAYPVEPTAAGILPHDATTTEGGIDVAGTSRPDRTLVIAGCDPLVGMLVQEMAERHAIRVLPLLRSSSEALDLLRQGLVHAAGVHLTDGSGHGANDHAVTSALGAGHVLIHQLRWDAGIAVGTGRPERTLRSLLQANVRWVNREEGSAARDTFDRLLGRGRKPHGYQQVARGHRAIAEAVSSGWAEAGVCIRPAATDARVDFITLNREAYELCVPEHTLDDSRIVALMATLRSRRYRQLVADVPGCESSDSGEQRLVTLTASPVATRRAPRSQRSPSGAAR